MSQGDPIDHIAVGALIGLAPWWTDLFHAVSSLAAFICVVTGAIIGLHGVYRIIKPRVR